MIAQAKRSMWFSHLPFSGCQKRAVGLLRSHGEPRAIDDFSLHIFLLICYLSNRYDCFQVLSLSAPIILFEMLVLVHGSCWCHLQFALLWSGWLAVFWWQLCCVIWVWNLDLKHLECVEKCWMYWCIDSFSRIERQKSYLNWYHVLWLEATEMTMRLPTGLYISTHSNFFFYIDAA